MALSLCITGNTFAEENKNASDTPKITQNTSENTAKSRVDREARKKEIKESREEIKKLVSAFRKDPTDENLAALRNQISINYDKGIERKKAKLEELNNKIEKLKKDIEEMTKERENNINKKLNKYTESKNKKDKKDKKDRKDKKDKKDKKEKEQSLKNETKETKEVSNEKGKEDIKKDK